MRCYLSWSTGCGSASNQLLRALDELESNVKFAGQFRLATLLEIAGLSTSLDDKLAAQLAVKFAREFHSAAELVEQRTVC